MSSRLRVPSIVLLVSLACAAPSVAEATPIYAIRAANACDTCHIEPSG